MLGSGDSLDGENAFSSSPAENQRLSAHGQRQANGAENAAIQISAFPGALEIPVRNFHILRHSFATRCIEYGMGSNPSPKSWATPTCKPPCGCMSIPPWNPNVAPWNWQAPCPASRKKPIRRQESGHGNLKKRKLPIGFLREYRQGFSLAKAFLLFYYTMDS